jgi:SAM-dependent methyltransferase
VACDTLKRLVGRVPGARWGWRQAWKVLGIASGVFYNSLLMQAAEAYVRHYYGWRTRLLWRGPDLPEWFDHRADLYTWSDSRNPLWVERGVYSREVMFEGCRVLDLCCGDGFYPYRFYAEIASHVDAVDRDAKAIRHARRWHSHPQLSYFLMDVVTDTFPGGRYDVITWDAAIEHFSVEQARIVLRKCVDALKSPEGLLCGYTILARTQEKSRPEHQHEFSSPQELKGLLGEFFPFVGTVETEYPERDNLYFRGAFRENRLRRFT